MSPDIYTEGDYMTYYVRLMQQQSMSARHEMLHAVDIAPVPESPRPKGVIYLDEL